MSDTLTELITDSLISFGSPLLMKVFDPCIFLMERHTNHVSLSSYCEKAEGLLRCGDVLCRVDFHTFSDGNESHSEGGSQGGASCSHCCVASLAFFIVCSATSFGACVVKFISSTTIMSTV